MTLRKRHPDTARRWGSFTAALTVAATLLTAVVMILTSSPAGAETPAERCKRETAAYNNAWKNTWVQANPGKKPSDAPPPPVPYTCGGEDNGPAPTLQTSPTTPDGSTQQETTESEEPSRDRPHDGGPSQTQPTDRREIEHPESTQSAIGEEDRSQRSQPVPSATLPTAENDPEGFITWYTSPGGLKYTVRALSRDEALALNLISELTEYLRMKPGAIPSFTHLISKHEVDSPEHHKPVSCFQKEDIENIRAHDNGPFALKGKGRAYWCGDEQWIRNQAEARCDGTANWPTYSYQGCETTPLYGVNWNVYQVRYDWKFCAADLSFKFNVCLARDTPWDKWNFHANGAASLIGRGN